MKASFGIGRRRFLASSLAAGTVVGLGARPVWGQASKPIKIGAILSVSGTFAQVGGDNVNGMKLYFDQIGNKIAGRPIELIIEDDELKPQIGLQKLRKLVESDKVDIVTGPVSSGVANAMVPYIKQTNSLWVISSAGLASLTRENKGPLIFRTSTTTWQTNAPLGEWCAKNMSKEALGIAADFAGGRDTVAEFRASFVAGGGKMVREVYPPLGTTDFSAYLADIRSAKPPLVFAFFSGADAVNFIKQYEQFGLKKDIPMVAAGFTVEQDVLPAQGKAALGIISGLHYTDSLETPVNRKFVADYKARYSAIPSFASEYGYVAARTFDEAIKATGGNTDSKEKVAEALRKVAFEAPRGPISFDPVTQNVIQNSYIRKVVEVEGRFANQVVATIPAMRDPG